MSNSEDTLLEFPCRFPLKTFGKDAQALEAAVVQILEQNLDDISLCSYQQRNSSGGKYHSFTATFTATSKAQLDSIYQAIADSDAVIMAL